MTLLILLPIASPKIPSTLSQGGIQPHWRVLQDILNDSFICQQDLSEYVGLQNNE